MNPHFHDEFVELCALFYSGELTDEEWALLQVHLAYCDSCRIAFEEYKHIASHVIPAMAAGAAADDLQVPEESTISFQAAEQRLLDELSPSPTPEISAVPEATSRRPFYGWLLAASFAFAASLVGVHYVRIAEHPKTQLPPAATVQPVAPSQASAPGRLPDARPHGEDVAALQQEVNAAEAQSSKLSRQIADMQQELQSQQAERQQLSASRDALTKDLAAAQTEVQALRVQSASASAEGVQWTAQTKSLESKVQELTVALAEKERALNEKDRIVSSDKEFMAHEHEIRDLISARDLYIADIYDVAQTGKTSKPFGRIFYTKSQSLVFYGYDLDKQVGLGKQPATFQAWGSGDDKQNVSLGLFSQDGTQKRWVLRFNDTKILGRINRVFVTAEPQGGSSKPTGKPLLLAYLQVEPNHP